MRVCTTEWAEKSPVTWSHLRTAHSLSAKYPVVAKAGLLPTCEWREQLAVSSSRLQSVLAELHDAPQRQTPVRLQHHFSLCPEWW